MTSRTTIEEAREARSRSRRRARWIVAAVASLVVAGAPARDHRAHAVPASAAPLELRIAPESVRPEKGHAWIVTLPPEWAASSSDLKHLDRSRLRLTENGTPLGPGNATHAEIREEGTGAYSHWQTALYFSTSDNSDPRRNGRTYVVVIPAGGD